MENNKPICDFPRLKKELRKLGYVIGSAQPYVPIKNVDVDLGRSIQSGEIEICNKGIFWLDEDTGEKHQIFLYKKDYDMERYGKPRFHICNCTALQTIGSNKYRRANTGTVSVWDRSQNKNVEVSNLPLCKYCLELLREENILNYGRSMTSDEFEQILRESSDDSVNNKEQDVDLEGYLWKWQKISEAYRTKKNYTCEICGITPKSKFDRQYIHVHHKDGNKTNNKESNLQCVCILCHSNMNTKHKLNFSKGANRVMLDSFKKKYPEAGKRDNQ